VRELVHCIEGECFCNYFKITKEEERYKNGKFSERIS
jgi:hypothetical protein